MSHGTGHAFSKIVNRKLGVLVAAILLPGGLIALLSAYVIKRLSQTARGQRVIAKARDNVPAWATNFRMPTLGHGTRHAA
jgi:hypothetical protein